MSRGAAVLLSAVMVSAAGLPVRAPQAAAAPARRAAALGTVAITPTSGAVDGNPMLNSATTSTPCPAGYGAGALLRVGPVGGPYSNIARPVTTGNYDKAPVTMNPNRSMTDSQGQQPGDGEYVIVVECISDTLGPHGNRFETPIVVSGNTWRVKGAAGAPAPGGTGNPGGPAPGPSSGAATPNATSAAAANPAGAPTTAPGLAGARAGRGSALPWILVGVALVLAAAGAAAVLVIRRRRSLQS
jgi:hypothetical protein